MPYEVLAGMPLVRGMPLVSTTLSSFIEFLYAPLGSFKAGHLNNFFYSCFVRNICTIKKIKEKKTMSRTSYCVKEIINDVR